MSRFFSLILICFAATVAQAQTPPDNGAPTSIPEAAAPDTAPPQISAPAGAKVFFKNLKNGAKVKKKFKVVFAVKNIKIRKAGEDPEDHKSGHHHLIIDGAAVPVGEVIPTDATHLHFGKGQTDAEVTLEPGPHTLTMQFADGAHRSYGPKLSATVKVTVK